MDKPLKGIKVLDLSTFVAAPVCCRLLADLGADVIKIERPEGDGWRLTGINYVPSRFSKDENPVFDIYNAGKKMIALDMKTPEGSTIFHQLLSQADVFVTNNREKALKRLGADYETLKGKYPRLIYAQVTGFGAKGPDADTPAFDTTAFWSRTGFMRDMAVVGDDGSYNPTYPPSGMGDTVTAYLLLSQINAALYQRLSTGRGQRVEACLFHTGIFTMGTMQITNQRPWGRQYPTYRYEHSSPGGYYECADGEWIYIATGMVLKLLGQLANATGRLDVLEDPRFNTVEGRNAHKKELYEIFKQEFRKKPLKEWLAIAKDLDFAAMPYNHFGDLAEDEQAWANDFLERITFRSGNTDVMPRSPLHMESVQDLQTVPAPYCGGDTVEVLRGLGYGDEEIRRLSDANVVLIAES